MIRAKEVVAEHIKAKTVDIEDEVHVGRILTRQCDVAYHFLLKDDREVFQEGKRLWIFSNDFMLPLPLLREFSFTLSVSAFTCSKLTIKTLEQGVKFV